MSHLPCLHALSTLSTYLSTALPASDHTLANQIALTFPLFSKMTDLQYKTTMLSLHYTFCLNFHFLSLFSLFPSFPHSMAISLCFHTV